MITPIVNRPALVRAALLATRSFVVLDTETSGLKRNNSVVSVGLLIDDNIYIMFVRSRVAPNVALDRYRWALGPLSARTDLTVVGHNVGFDLGMLWRDGIRVSGIVHDSEMVMRLIDPDRGKNKDVLAARIDRTAPPGSPRSLNYKLKDAANQLLGLHLVGFPDTAMDILPYEQHVRYLTSDLLGTKALYEYLLARLTPGQAQYHAALVAPLTPILVAMTETGVGINIPYLQSEAKRLRRLIDSTSAEHNEQFGRPLGMNQQEMRGWLFGVLGLAPCRWVRLTARGRSLGRMVGPPSLAIEHLKLLRARCHNQAARESLDAIMAYRKLCTLLVGLNKLSRYIDPDTGKVHTQLSPRQATGRISSTGPNLQSIAKMKTVLEEQFRPRNALTAAEGHVLVGFDIGQADIRVMSDAIVRFPCSAGEHIAALRAERLEVLESAIGRRLEDLRLWRNRAYAGGSPTLPRFDPTLPCAMATILNTPGADLYSSTAQRVLGKITVSKAERNTFKEIVLSLANSMGPGGLAKRLGYGEDPVAVLRARRELDAFWAAFPQVFHYLELMRWQVALTGQTESWAGRTRACSAHRWLVTLPRIEILVSYACGEWYWLDVVPLRPSRRVLTCWIRKAWDATYKSHNHGKLIYEAGRGPLCTYPYRLYQDGDLLFRLPARNLAWRSIRRVRTSTEEAQYHGFDATARSLINHVFQGGTADVMRAAMLRAEPVCRTADARMLLQIHDELLFEVEQGVVGDFMTRMKSILVQPPEPGWTIPIRVEAKVGYKFGSMKPVWKLNHTY